MPEIAAPPARRLRAEVEKASRGAVAKTPSGESAADIIGPWVQWNVDTSGTPVPQTVISRMAKHVKECIRDGYITDEIKHGLAIWSAMQSQQPMLAPTKLPTLVWNYARNTRSGADRWRQDMRALVAEFVSAGNIEASALGTGTAAQRRRAANDAAADAWRNSQ